MLNPKPCPLCGEATLKTWRTIIPSTPLRYQIECASCHYCGKKALTRWGAVLDVSPDSEGKLYMTEFLSAPRDREEQMLRQWRRIVEEDEEE